MSLKLGEGLLQETFTTLRACGAGRIECVVYWAGPVTTPDLVDQVIHPHHTGEPDYYEIDQTWLNRIWFELNAKRVEIRAQVHTHGGRAFHSPVDDAFPFMQTEGFLSLVIPRFGLGPVCLDGAYLTELHAGGLWKEHDPAAVLEAA